jgi:hypothetical protein
MFKIEAEGFISTKLFNAKQVMIEDKPVTYLNTSIGSKYTNKYTNAESWDNLRLLFKGDIADSLKANCQPRDLIRVEGVLHEKSYKNEAGVTIRYMEATVHKFRKLEINKAKPKPQGNAISKLSKEDLAKFSPEQLAILMK